MIDGIEYAIAAALAGVLLGSFLNVCIYRIPRDVSVVAPRSFCPECGTPVRWYDNIPVISYLLLDGKCRSCRQPIGIRYPIVEMATAILFAVTTLRYGWTLATLKWMIFESLVVVLFWTDWEERLLPDEFTLGGTVIGLILAAFVMTPGILGPLFLPAWKPAWQSLFNSTIGAAFLTGPIWILGVLYKAVRKREGLGFGDVKLLVLVGVFLGLENGLITLFFGAVGGAVVGLIFVFGTKKSFSETELPFGSFLCAAAAIVPLVNR